MSNLNGTKAGAIGTPAIGSKGLTLCCPDCGSILRDVQALGRWHRTLFGDHYFECRNCDYTFNKKDEENTEPPKELVIPAKPLEHIEDAES